MHWKFDIFQVMIIDNYNKVSSEGLGDNYYVNLDGILYLGKYYQ